MATETKITLPVLGITCANCATTIERQAKKVAGVKQANVNLSTDQVQVNYDPTKTTPQAIIQRIEHAGYGVPFSYARIANYGHDLRQLRSYRGAHFEQKGARHP